MGTGWPSVPMREIAVPVQRPVEVVPGRAYRTLGVKLWGNGAYEREIIDGSQTAAKVLYEVREDDLIINKIWVRNGSVAIVGPEVSGCAGSNEFPTFQLNPERILPRWLHWYTKTRELWTKCDALSQGTSGKNRIRPERFLTVEIPLPPLAEQRRIVAKIEQLAGKIEEARGLEIGVAHQAEQLCRTIIANPSDGPIVPTPMSQLVDCRRPDVVVDANETYRFAGVYCFGRGVFQSETKTGMEFAYKQLTQLRSGEFVYPKLMAWEGALAVVPAECDGLFVSPEFPVFSIRLDRVLPEVLDVHFRTPAIWPHLSGASTGTNVRRRRLNPANFLMYQFPLPPMETQLRLREVKAKIDQLKSLQAQTAAELEALLPSVLDKAFRGEL